MRDLASPLLSPRVVSGLTGLSPQAIRRWETYGVPASSEVLARSGRRRRSLARLYSWRDVEELQQATYLVEHEGVSMAAAKRLLVRTASAGLDRELILARPKPRLRSTREGRVVAVRLPRSAKRRSRRDRHTA